MGSTPTRGSESPERRRIAVGLGTGKLDAPRGTTGFGKVVDSTSELVVGKGMPDSSAPRSDRLNAPCPAVGSVGRPAPDPSAPPSNALSIADSAPGDGRLSMTMPVSDPGATP